jgi:hypothetical protein
MPKPKYPKDSNPPPYSSVPATADAAALPRRHVLPKDLPAAIKQLDDQELDRLQAAVLAEQKRRGKNPSERLSCWTSRGSRRLPFIWTPGKPNAVRAAFKVGVKPAQIALHCVNCRDHEAIIADLQVWVENLRQPPNAQP